MKRRVRLLGIAAVLALVAAAPLPSPAATSVNSCTMLTTWTFSSRLTMTHSTRTITASYSGACEYILVNNGANQNFTPDGWTNTYSFTGNCLAGSTTYLFPGNSGTLVGGSAFAVVGHNPFYDDSEMVEVTALAPTNGTPCDLKQATGVAQFEFYGTF